MAGAEVVSRSTGPRVSDTEGLRERGSGRVLGTAGNATGGCNEGARGGGTEEAKVLFSR